MTARSFQSTPCFQIDDELKPDIGSGTLYQLLQTDWIYQEQSPKPDVKSRFYNDNRLRIRIKSKSKNGSISKAKGIPLRFVCKIEIIDLSYCDAVVYHGILR